MKIEMSIDKLSFTGKLSSMIDSTGINDFLSSGIIESTYFYSPNNFMYQHNWNFPDGSFFQYGASGDVHNARLEFNPNKCNWKVIDKLIARLKYPKITRIDWAIDYHDINFNKYLIKDTVGRKEITYLSRSKKLETKYLGSPKSDKFIRIYNKAIQEKKKKSDDVEEEVETKNHWWRCEAVVKDFTMEVEKEMLSMIEIDGKQSKLMKTEKVKTDGYLFQNPFLAMEIYQKREKKNDGHLKASEKAMIFYLKYHPEEWNELSPNTRKKYEALEWECDWELIEEQPALIFEKEKSRLAHELESWLKPAINNGTYLTGNITNIEYSMMYLRKQMGLEEEERKQKPMPKLNLPNLEEWQEFKNNI